MAIGSGSRQVFKYIEESTRGTTPAGTWKSMRINSSDIQPVKTALTSQEVRPDREVVTFRHGQRSAAGSVVSEVILGNSDDWLRYALGGTWETPTKSNDIGITNPDQLVCSSDSLVTDGFRPGDIVTVGGLTASGENGDYRVTAAAAGALTLANLDGSAINLTTEAESGAPTLTLKGSRCSIGTNLLAVSGERGFEDISRFQPYTGLAVNSLGVAISPTELPKFTFEMLGMNFGAMLTATQDASATAAPTNEAMAPIDGKIYEGGVQAGFLTALSLQLANGRGLVPVIGATSSPDITEGDANLTGSISALFQDETLFNKFVNETPTTIWQRLVDPNDTAHFLNLVVPRAKYSGGSIQAPRTGEVTLDMPFQAVKDPVTGTTFSIQRSNA